MNDDKAIQVQDLHKNLSDVYAVQGVSFDVQAGEVFSLLGPNGAGKSTIITMLSCLLEPTQGDARVSGHSILGEPMAVKEAIGVVPQEIALYEDLSARENLTFWGKMYGLRGAPLHRRVDEMLEVTGLTERQKGRVRKFSGGMKRRLNIGIALLHTDADRLGDGRLSEHRDARPGPGFSAAPGGHPAGLRRRFLWTGSVALRI